MEDIKKGLQTVVNKAWDDASFKTELVADPVSAIESATGLNVPGDVKIVVNDQTDEDVIYLNIPPKPDFDNMELTDEQLEQVAGGEIFATTFAVTFVVSVQTTISAASAINDNNKKKGKKGW